MGRTSHAWVRVAGAACLATVLTLALPPGPARTLAYLVTAVGSVAAIWLGTRRHRPTRAAAWYLVSRRDDLLGRGQRRPGHGRPDGAGPDGRPGLYGGLYPLALLGLLIAVLGARGA